jgi:tetratricopeptide (TPR) repeat protein
MTSIDEQTPIRERWTARGPGSGDEETAGALLRLAQRLHPVGDRRLAEIREQLRSGIPHRAHARLPRSRFRQVAVAAGLVLLGGALSASALQLLHRASERSTESAAPTALPRSKSARRSSADATKTPEPLSPATMPEVLVPASPEPPPEPASAVPVLRSGRIVAARETPSSQRTEPPRPGPAIAPPVGSSALARESGLLASAIVKLRRDGEPGQALAILDQLRAEFGSGALAQEANATRIEALLRLGRNGQALALLDAQTLSARGLAGQMLVARAELRAEQGRFSAALRDFDELLSGRGQPDSVTERARYGRATCRAKSGDWDGARADFQQYLREFPQGGFAERARGVLAQKAR